MGLDPWKHPVRLIRDGLNHPLRFAKGMPLITAPFAPVLDREPILIESRIRFVIGIISRP
jgi:hypothetical protein